MLKVAITSLGCPRNLVDSEVMIGSLKNEGYKITDVDDSPDIHIINTCSFIKSAREESIDAILEAAQLKKEGRITRLIVSGCLPQLYKDEILKDLPEVDMIVGTGEFHKIGAYIKNLNDVKETCRVSKKVDFLYNENSPRILLTPGHYAYVKISEGCDNCCSYCRIRALRGRLRSRTIKSVISEIEHISSEQDLKEVNLIGQDTTLFGKDLYSKPALHGLLRKIASLKNDVKWIRLLYTHPAHYTDDLILAIKEEEKICKYLDIPIQHISDPVLSRMNRHTQKKDIIDLIEKLRSSIPGVFLRTSIIVGFPGETDKEFAELLDFVREARFERLGAFLYSREEGTPAANFKSQIPDEIKQERFDAIMKAQQGIAIELNNAFLGKDMEVLIEEKLEGENDKYMGRSSGDAPEVDGTVYVTGKNLRIGQFYPVRVTDALEYDLVGETI